MEIRVLCALIFIPWFQGVSADLKSNLKYFEVIHAKSFGHNIVKRGIHPSDHPFNKIREVNFKVRNGNASESLLISNLIVKKIYLANNYLGLYSFEAIK